MRRVAVMKALLATAGAATAASALPPPAAAATLGPVEVVRDSGAVNCGPAFPPPQKAGQRHDLDIPDEPCRAWVSASGEVTLLTTHTQARYDRGPSLGALHHESGMVTQNDPT